MKKRLLAVLIAILIVSLLSVTLVACSDKDNDNNPDGGVVTTPDTPASSDEPDTPDTPVDPSETPSAPSETPADPSETPADPSETPDTGITFTSSMSKEEIIEILNKVENLAWEWYINGERYYNFTQYIGTNYAVATQSNGDEHYFDIQFVEDNRRYDLEALSGGDEDYEDIYIVDYSGCDCDFNLFRRMVNALIKWINEGNYAVENGNIKVEETSTSGGETVTQTYIFKDFNTTTMPELPEKLKDYKTMAATVDAVVYELKGDEYYEVTFADYYIESFEVSAEYNGKPVTGFTYNCYAYYLKTITLPTSIERLNKECRHYAEDGELHIIYKGTKAQWEAITNSDVWSKAEGVRITCSDGDYVVITEE